MYRQFLQRIATAGALVPVSVMPAAADSIPAFYRGKQVQIVIGYGTGGGYDTYARLLARHIGRHIPGTPTVVAQNMPGAASRKAANWLYQLAPKDGTSLAVLAQTTASEQALGRPQIGFDVRRFNWIGNMVAVNNVVIVWAKTGVRSIEDAKRRPLVMGASGSTGPAMLYPTVSNHLFATQFKVVTGYPSGGDIMIALQRGELDGRGSDSWASLKSSNADWLRDRKVNILFQVGPRREPDLPDVMLWRELAKDDEQRQVLDFLSGDVTVGRPLLTAPGVPAERVHALRKAFDDAMNDPAYRSAAKKLNMYLNPVGGEEVQRLVNRIANTSPIVIEKVKAAIAGKDAP